MSQLVQESLQELHFMDLIRAGIWLYHQNKGNKTLYCHFTGKIYAASCDITRWRFMGKFLPIKILGEDNEL